MNANVYLAFSINMILVLPACEMGGEDNGSNGICPDFATSGDIPLGETPPLPGESCAEPPTVGSMLFEAAVSAGNAQREAIAAELLDPGRITVLTCGTGGPLPSDRAQACTAVFVGGQFLLFDAGDGAQPSMEDLGLPVTDITAVFLTHFHSDHIADLGEVMSRTWIQGRDALLPVYGGPALERVVEGFNIAYSADESYRIAHHGEKVLPANTLMAEARRIDDVSEEGSVVYEEDGVVVRAFEVDHSPIFPALGFRVEYGGRVVGIGGDTIDAPGFRNLAAGADVLVSEVLAPQFALDGACAFERLGDDRNAKIFRDIRTYHVFPGQLGQIAAEANVGTLVLTHQVPVQTPEQAQTTYVPAISANFAGEIVVAEDGTRVTLDL